MLNINAIIQGRVRAIQDLLLEMLGDLGEIPEELEAIVMSQADVEVLNAWVKQVSKCETIEEVERTRELLIEVALGFV